MRHHHLRSTLAALIACSSLISVAPGIAAADTIAGPTGPTSVAPVTTTAPGTTASSDAKNNGGGCSYGGSTSTSTTIMSGGHMVTSTTTVSCSNGTITTRTVSGKF